VRIPEPFAVPMHARAGTVAAAVKALIEASAFMRRKHLHFPPQGSSQSRPSNARALRPRKESGFAKVAWDAVCALMSWFMG